MRAQKRKEMICMLQTITSLDSQILFWIQQNIRSDSATLFWEFMTNLENTGILWIFVTLILLFRKKSPLSFTNSYPDAIVYRHWLRLLWLECPGYIWEFITLQIFWQVSWLDLPLPKRQSGWYKKWDPVTGFPRNLFLSSILTAENI